MDARKPSEKPELTADMTETLRYLAGPCKGASVATHFIAKYAVGHPTADLATTRRMLAKMRQCGLVEGVTSGGKVYWWRITDAGRDTLTSARYAERDQQRESI